MKERSGYSRYTAKCATCVCHLSSLGLCLWEQVQNYDDALAKIQAATGLTDINELVTSFINSEGENFSLFNFANELNQVRFTPSPRVCVKLRHELQGCAVLAHAFASVRTNAAE